MCGRTWDLALSNKLSEDYLPIPKYLLFGRYFELMSLINIEAANSYLNMQKSSTLQLNTWSRMPTHYRYKQQSTTRAELD